MYILCLPDAPYRWELQVTCPQSTHSPNPQSAGAPSGRHGNGRGRGSDGGSGGSHPGSWYKWEMCRLNGCFEPDMNLRLWVCAPGRVWQNRIIVNIFDASSAVASAADHYTTCMFCVSHWVESMSDITQIHFIEALNVRLKCIEYQIIGIGLKKKMKTNKNTSFCVNIIVFYHTDTECVPLTFAWARVRAWTGPCRSLLCEETLNESGAGRDAAAPAQPECCHAPSPWSYALHLHTRTQTQIQYECTSSCTEPEKQTHTVMFPVVCTVLRTTDAECCRTSPRNVLQANEQLAHWLAAHVSCSQEPTVSAVSHLRSVSDSSIISPWSWSWSVSASATKRSRNASTLQHIREPDSLVTCRWTLRSQKTWN